MKGRKYRRSQHFIHTVYEKGFGFRAPYQILLDAAFVREAMRNKIFLRDMLPEVFGGPVKILITPCVLAELGRLDREATAAAGSSDPSAITGSALMAKRLEMLRKCHDPAHGVSCGARDCLVSTIQSSPLAHFAIGAQEVELRGLVRRGLPGVPILFIQRGLVLMEEPSRETRHLAATREQAKLGIPEFELKGLLKSKKKTDDSDGDQSRATKKRRRKAKNPNPLSVKQRKEKKKKDIVVGLKNGKQQASKDGEKTGKKRKRRHRKKGQDICTKE